MAIYLTIILLALQSIFVGSNPTTICDKNHEDEISLIKIDPTNMVFLRGTITSTSASKIVNQLLQLKSKEIYLYIDSPGGSVMSGLQIIQTIESLQQSGTKVYTIGNNAASMAYIIHQYGTERYVTQWSLLMQHQMSLGMEGQYYNLKSYNSLIDKLHTKLLEKQAKIAGITVSEFNELTRHDMWLLGNESVQKGFADKIVNVICDFRPTLESEILHTFFGDVTIVYSTCPLSNKPVEVKFADNMSNEQIIQAKSQIESYFDVEYKSDNIKQTNAFN